MHVSVVGDGDAEPAHEVLLHEAVLGDGERFRGGMDGRFLPGDLKRSGRHVLELARDHVDIGGKGAERRLVLERPDRRERRHVEGRRIRFIGIDMGLEPEPRRGERQHTAELAAAQDADDASRRQGFRHYPLGPRLRRRFVPHARL